MILKLRNGKILIEENSIPSDVSNTEISYDYELGTNHYDTVLIINDDVYRGLNPKVNLDLGEDEINLQVKLLDSRRRVIRKYIGTYKYLKLCLIGTSELMDVYKQLELLYNENVKLKEQGEVI